MVDIPRVGVNDPKTVFSARDIVGASAHPSVILIGDFVWEVIGSICDGVPPHSGEIPLIQFFDVSDITIVVSIHPDAEYLIGGDILEMKLIVEGRSSHGFIQSEFSAVINPCVICRAGYGAHVDDQVADVIPVIDVEYALKILASGLTADEFSEELLSGDLREEAGFQFFTIGVPDNELSQKILGNLTVEPPKQLLAVRLL